jgi:dephospho-CoA kinase
MEKYNLSEFGLNKQSLKRKLNEITHPCVKSSLVEILDERTSKYTLETIEYLIKGFYSGIGQIEKTEKEQPLSVYYAKQNKEKYKKLKTLIDIKKNGSIDVVLEKEIKKVVRESQNSFISFEKYNEKLETIADKYGVNPTKVYKISNEIETEWLNEITK